MRLLLFNICIAGITSILLNSCNSKNQLEEEKQNGDLNNTFIDSVPVETNSLIYQAYLDSLVKAGWTKDKITDGQLPLCYNFLPVYDTAIDNYLKINVGTNTNVVIKLMDVKHHQCQRYVYVNSRSSYSIQNIPEGLYYLKIAYGKDWISKLEKNKCLGKFARKPIYSVGKETLDFNILKSAKGISIPSFELSLDVIETGVANSFDSHNISEDEFNQ